MSRLARYLLLALLPLAISAQADRRLRPEQAVVPPAAQEARVALVIGNGAYQGAPLRNPVNDARAMAEALKGCGFQVTELENADREQMMQALRGFGGRIQRGGVGLFYFAGHGLQVKGKNYLVPVNAGIATEDEVAFNSLDAEAVLAKMETAGNRLNIVILDACRDNPFGRDSRGLQQGLAQMDAPAGTYLAFATSPGHTAADGTGDHGLYTQQLLANLRTPGLVLENLFKRVRAGVMLATQGEQVPWENSSILGDFYFVPGTGGATPGPVSPLPVAIQPGIHFRPAPTPTPAEKELLAAMHVKGLERVLPLAKPLAAKGSLYGQFALDYMITDQATRNQAMGAYAEAGIPMAMVEHARFLLEDPLSASEVDEARSWLDQAITLGEPAAMMKLGIELVKGTHFPRNLDRAGNLFAQAARLDRGNYYGVGCLFWDDEDFRAAYTSAVADATGFAFMNRGAELGDIGAMGMLTIAYEWGRHTPKDPGQALSWALDAAAQGPDPYWMAVVGEFYRDVEDPAYRSGEKAIVWLTKAGEKGYAHAYGELAKMYLLGDLVPKNPSKALDLYRKASEENDAESQRDLSRLYAEGKETAQDVSKAYFWYLAAGDIWGDEGVKRLGAKMGEAEQKRIRDKYAKWRRGRAEKGSHEDQFRLGEAYEAGIGVPRSLDHAYFWYLLAGDDVPVWRYDRERLMKELGAAECARIKTLAEKWKPKP
jgi:TPR repeat protein